MPEEPTIIGVSGVYHPGRRCSVEFGPLAAHAVELSGATGTPKIGYLATACGDQEARLAQRQEAARLRGWRLNPLTLFMMPNVDNVEGYLFDQDLIWVDGGSVVNLLAVWRAHGLDEIFRRLWLSGKVLGGVSAGSMCWHAGGATDSFGPDLRPCINGLGFLPWGNGVHYGVNPQRRELLCRMVGEGLFPKAYSSENGVGIVYRGTEVSEFVCDRPDVYGWVTEQVPGKEGPEAFHEEPITPRRLPD
ncbi:peptidase E [Cutibacterium avidum]|uniref:Type 1 glutamine amidotransferase-like domain-containing protein n=1 Tax=Cutibacterium avidum TaxID=33010 RepID=UPI00209315D2|nr:peptidase E [Cutibacterium avidum]MCO6663893.1 peptidase E [Cutibacterium avidum]